VPLSRSMLPCGLESPGRSWPSRLAHHGWPPVGRGQDDTARYDACSCQRRRRSPPANLTFQRSFDPAPARSNLAVGSTGLQSPFAASVQAGNPARHQHPERLLRSEAFLLLKVRSRHESGCPTRERRCSPGIFLLQSLLPSRVRSGSPADARIRTTGLLPASSHRPLTSLATPAGRNPSVPPEPQSLKRRKDWLVPLGTTCSPGVSHLVGVSRQFEFPTTRDYLFSSGETPCLQNACTHLWVGWSLDEELLRILRSTSGPFRSGRALKLIFFG